MLSLRVLGCWWLYFYWEKWESPAHMQWFTFIVPKWCLLWSEVASSEFFQQLQDVQRCWLHMYHCWLVNRKPILTRSYNTCSTSKKNLYEPLPLLVFGMLPIICGLLALTLPETLNKSLPDTVCFLYVNKISLQTKCFLL